MKRFAPSRAMLRLLLLLAVDLLLLLAFAAFVWFDNAVNRGIVYHPAPEPIPFTDGPQVGVNAYNLHLEPDPAVVTRTLQLAKDMGATYVRMQVPWEDIEIDGRGDFEDRRNIEAVGVVSAWAKYDRIVETANRLDIELVMRLERPPDWARQYFGTTEVFKQGLLVDGNSTGPPDDFEEFGRFVRILVERYRGKVRFFQIWNEPNLKNEWNWQTPAPEDFITLLRIGYTAVKETNPDAVVLFPSLAPTDGLDVRAPMTELEYLDRMYQLGAGDFFDIMAAQAYGLGQSPDEHRYVFLRGRGNWNWRHPIDTRNDVSRVVLLREVMERNGDSVTPIWIGEFGWNSAPETIPPDRRFVWGQPVSEQQKGEYLVAQIERAQREWPWMGAMNVWMLRYGGYQEADPSDPTPYFALVTRDWQTLPAYDQLKTYLSQPVVAGVGAHQWTHPAVEPIADGWRIRFTSGRITLVGGLGGDIQPTIDGDATTLARDGLDGQQALSTGWLADGPHTLEVVAPGAAPPTRFIVERRQPLPWLWPTAPLVLVGLLALSGAATLHAGYSFVDRLLAWIARDRRRATLVVLCGLVLGLLAFYRLSPRLPPTLLGLAIFGGFALLRPDLALLFVPLTVPLFFMPKGIWDADFGIREAGLRLPLHEIVLLVTFGATVARELGARLWSIGQTRSPGDGETKRRGDETGRLGTQHAARSMQHLLPLVLFLVAGTVGVVVAGDRSPALREWRWLIVEPLLFYGLVRWHMREQGTGDREQRTAEPPVGAGLAPSQRGTAAPPVGAGRVPAERNYTWLLLTFWLVGGALVGLLGLLQFAGLNLVPLIGDKVGFSNDQIFVEGVQRVTSVYGHPNNLGLYLGRVWPVAAVLALAAQGTGNRGQGDRDTGRQGEKPPRVKLHNRVLLPASFIFYLLSFLLALGGLLVSFSRGAYLGVFAALVVLVLLLGPRDRRRWYLLGGLAGLAGLAAFGVAVAVLLGIDRLNPLSASGGTRFATWASALAMLRDHPLFGIGLDQFVRLYPDYIDPALASTNEINTAHPHNLVLDILLRTGWLGLLAFGWLLVRFFRKTGNRDQGTTEPRTNSQEPTAKNQNTEAQAMRESQLPSAGGGIERGDHGTFNAQFLLSAGLAAAMVAALVHGMVDAFYFWPDLAFTFWLLLALAEGE